MIVEETIGIYEDDDTKYKFDFIKRQVVIKNHKNTDIIVLTFPEWFILISSFTEAYKNWLNEPYPSSPSQSTRNEELK